MKSLHIINFVISYRQAMRVKGITCAPEALWTHGVIKYFFESSVSLTCPCSLD